jgi:hypothetical protein
MASSCRGIVTGLGHAHGADQCEGQTASFTGPTLWTLLNERKENVEQQSEAIDSRRRSGGHFNGVFIRSSRRKLKLPASPEDNKYQPRRGVQFLRCPAIKQRDNRYY